LRSGLGLSLIAAGHFAVALEVLEKDIDKIPGEYRKIAGMFNSAVAHWGRDGVADLGLFRQVVEAKNATELKESPRNANFNQCLALAYGVLEEKDVALSYLRKAREIAEKGYSDFSCWSYLRRGQYAFITELGEMESWVLSGVPLPRVLTRVRADGEGRGDYPHH
jgi:hypothetical protein